MLFAMKRCRIALILTAITMLSFAGAASGVSGVVATLAPPTVTTQPASNLAQSGFRMNGSINPNGVSTYGYFEWGTSANMSAYDATTPANLGAGTADVPLAFDKTGLACATTYYYRALAVTTGADAVVVRGAIVAATTSQCPSTPTATTQPASNQNFTSFRMNGSINPAGVSTQGYFEWGTNATLSTSTATPPTNMGSGTSSLALAYDLTGLSCGTTYYYRAAAIPTGGGTVRGSIVSASTVLCAPPPTVTTQPPSNITQTGFRMNGSITPPGPGVSTLGHFEWRPNGSTVYNLTPPMDMGSGTSAVALNFDLTGLSCGVVYWYRVVAVTSGGITQAGNEVIAVTSPCPPTVTTQPASNLAQSGFRMNGSINPNGVSTYGYFEWGTSANMSAYDATTPANLGAGTADVPLAFDKTGLACATTYYYRAVAVTSGANAVVVKGAIVAATTSQCPSTPTATTQPASNQNFTSFRMNGSIDPAGVSTQGYFEWGTNATLSTSTATPATNMGSGTSSLALAFDLTGLSCGTTYYYRAAAIPTGGSTVRGSIVSASTVLCGPLGAFTVSGTPHCNASLPPAPAVALKWGSSSGATNYTVYRNDAPVSGGTNLGSGQLTFDDNINVTAGTAYNYFVRATNANGSIDSNTISVNVPLDVCGATGPCALDCSADVPASGVAGVPLLFIASSSSSSCAGVASQSWAFGDGTTGSSSTVTHTYATVGLFNWTLTTSQDGSTCVRNGSLAIASATSGLPTIDYFRANRDQIAVGGSSDLTWAVRNASTLVLEGLGNVAANSGITVAPTGTTTYKLIATNSTGSQTATLTIRVDPVLNVSIRADRVTGTVPLDVAFTTLVSGGVPPYRYEWSFGGTSAQTTHRWTTTTAEDVSCNVTDARGTIQKSNVLRIVPSAKTATITLAFSDLTALNVGAARIGASADGATKVKVRAVTSSPGNVTFSFAGTAGSGRDGALFSFDGTGTSNDTARLTVPTTRDAGENVAAVYYKVPDDFANAGTSVPDARPVRTLTFSAQLAGIDGTSGVGTKDFHLRHAPVVFVHGIWSHGSTWDKFALTRDPDLLYRDEVVVADWDGVSSIQTGASQVRVYLNLALHRMRMQGIAASGVDVVAHSMGGLIAKQISHDAPGLVHKLITIDTPHLWSALADYLMAMRYDVFVSVFFINIYNHPIESGAIRDLQVSVGATARRVNTGSLRAHSIVGLASDDEPCTSTTDNKLPDLVNVLCTVTVARLDFLTGGCQRGLLTRILNNRPNDELVDVDSQRGGLSGAVTQFSSGGATGQHRCLAAHANMTADMPGGVSSRVKALLDTNRGTAAFEQYSLPPASLVKDEIASALSLSPSLPTASEAISITAPIEGQVVAPGSAIDVVITASPTFTSALVVTPDQVAPASAQPFRARIDIPATAIGPYAIGVRADTAADESATASITLRVVPNAPVTSLIVNPIEFFLNVGDTVKPFVRGVFADGVTRDLSRSTGVAFASSNPSIVSAFPDGTLRANGVGTARVTVSSDGASAEILINVEPLPRRRAVRH